MPVIIPRSTHDVPLDLPALTIPMGCFPALQSLNKFGTNEAVGTTYEDIWIPGGKLVHLATETLMEVASSDANDASAGTGAQTFTIEGYDQNYVGLSETITLNGQTPVTTVNLYRGINRAYIATAGSGGENAGDIYIADDVTAWTAGVPDTASAIQAEIGAGYGQTQIAMFTVPAGFTAYVSDLYVSAATGKTITFRLIDHNRNSNTHRVKVRATVTAESPFIPSFGSYLKFDEKHTIHLQALVDSTTAAVSGGFDIILVNNNAL